MKNLKNLVIITILSILVLGCEFFGIATAESTSNSISYYSKEIEYSTYVDDDGYFLEPVERRIFNENGKLEAIFKNFYSDQETVVEPFWANDLTKVYEVDDDGAETLIEYYEYEYQRDDWDYINDDDETVSTFDYILIKGESFDPDENLQSYYDVTYTVLATEYDIYTLIVDRNGDDEILAQQESTYITDGGGSQRYQTEKYYSLTDSDDTTSLDLEKEFAAFYDSADPYNYIYEIYHSFYALDETEPEEEFYYLTKYSRDGNGFIYEQADELYDSTGIPVLSTDPDYDDGTFDTASFPYTIDFDNIGERANVLNTEYDELGNITKDTRSYKGEITEITTYEYNDDSELIDESRYTEGGTFLRDRTIITYRDEYRDGVYYRVKETSTYKYYDYDNDVEGQSESSSASMRALSSRSISGETYSQAQSAYRKDISNNHH